MKKALSLYAFFFIFSYQSIAQNADSIWVAGNYYKKEVMIPMRDGVKLFTSMLIPKDSSEKHPVLLRRTPYACMPYGEDKMTPVWKSPYIMNYVKEKYILIVQDVRGRFMSEGEFEDIRPFNKNKKGNEIDEASDTYDAIDWMIKHIPGNNGNVGVFGVSYPGFYSTMAAASGHPALKAVSPQAPVTEWFLGDDVHHNGAFFSLDNFGFYTIFGPPRHGQVKEFPKPYIYPLKDNYNFFLKNPTVSHLTKILGDSIKFWNQVIEHPDYDDFWKQRDARKAIENIKPALLWVGGLFDAEDCYGAWSSYKATEKQSPSTNNKLVMGPWSHGQWARGEGDFLGNVRFGSKTSIWYQKNIEVPFFNYYLKGKGSIDDISKVTMFFTGENNWKKFTQWPPKDITNKQIYLNKNATLSFTKNINADKGYAEYTSDPHKPVPYNEGVHERRTVEYMTDDQRFAAQRPDVLVYETEPLKEDMTLAGPLTADLFVSISGTDVDFVVKLIDVFPEDFKYADSVKGDGKNYMMQGYQMLVRGEIMRGKYRNSFEKPEPFTPDKITEVKYTMPDIAHTFKKGHKIMIQVQSSWFPLADLNPQQFMNIYKAQEKDFKKATIRIYESSCVILPVMN